MIFKILYHSHPDGDLDTGREYSGKQACDFLLINLKKKKKWEDWECKRK